MFRRSSLLVVLLSLAVLGSSVELPNDSPAFWRDMEQRFAVVEGDIDANLALCTEYLAKLDEVRRNEHPSPEEIALYASLLQRKHIDVVLLHAKDCLQIIVQDPTEGGAQREALLTQTRTTIERLTRYAQVVEKALAKRDQSAPEGVKIEMAEAASKQLSKELKSLIMALKDKEKDLPITLSESAKRDVSIWMSDAAMGESLTTGLTAIEGGKTKWRRTDGNLISTTAVVLSGRISLTAGESDGALKGLRLVAIRTDAARQATPEVNKAVREKLRDIVSCFEKRDYGLLAKENLALSPIELQGLNPTTIAGKLDARRDAVIAIGKSALSDQANIFISSDKEAIVLPAYVDKIIAEEYRDHALRFIVMEDGRSWKLKPAIRTMSEVGIERYDGQYASKVVSDAPDAE